MGTPLFGGGGGESDGLHFIIELKFRHMKHLMILLPLV